MGVDCGVHNGVVEGVVAFERLLPTLVLLVELLAVTHRLLLRETLGLVERLVATSAILFRLDNEVEVISGVPDKLVLLFVALSSSRLARLDERFLNITRLLSELKGRLCSPRLAI